MSGVSRSSDAATVPHPTPRPPLGDPTYTVICPCGFYALCWSPTGGGRLDVCPACERATASYGKFTYLEEPSNV